MIGCDVEAIYQRLRSHRIGGFITSLGAISNPQPEAFSAKDLRDTILAEQVKTVDEQRYSGRKTKPTVNLSAEQPQLLSI